MRLVHFSDVHVTQPPLAEPLALLHPKRALGFMNHYVARRGRHFAGSGARLGALLEDAERQAADHLLCTGDLTMLSYEREFAAAARCFGARLERPERYSVLPGNHDRYTQAAMDERRFERWFGRVSAPGDVYPFVKRLGPGVTMVAVDAARPTGLGSSGRCGAGQLARLAEVLTDRALAQEFVVFALHYGIYRRTGGPDWPSHRLRDFRALVEVLDRDDVRVDLVVHGHLHRAFEVKTARRRVVCAGSATDLKVRAGYNVYELDLERRAFTTARRIWDEAAGGYAAERGHEAR